MRVEEVFARLYLDGGWAAAQTRALADTAIAGLAAAEKMTISRDALQHAVDKYRDARGLHSRKDLTAWLAAADLQQSDIVDYCRTELQREALLAAIPMSAVREWFEQHHAGYDAALLSVMSFEMEEDAWIARAAAMAAPEDFDELAWSRPQTDSALPMGGVLGWRFRRDLPSGVAAAVFDGNGVVGPLLVEGYFLVYRVWRIHTAALTPVVEATCRADHLAARIYKDDDR